MSLFRSRFVQAVLIVVLAFVVLRFGIRPPAPWSVIKIYLTVVFLAVLIYVSADTDSWRSFVGPIRSTLVDPGRRLLRVALAIVLPILLGYYAYTQAAATPEAPAELRAVHPAPPGSIQFRGKEINISGVDNPLRRDQTSFKKHVAAGGETYIKNCVYCHGDNLDGHGQFAPALSPPPADFQDPGTIAMLQEAYVFWRIAKGGPGLPRESTPWNSAMPSWEDRLTEEQIWEVIYYLYETTGYPPRVMGEGHAGLPGPADLRAGGGVFAGAHGALRPSDATAQTAADVALGKQVYEKHCALCHGAEGK